MADPAESAQPDYTGSCMIALYPPPKVAKALAVPDGLDADSMHVTIAYTGAAADVDLKGKLTSPGVDTWQALGQVLRNAFIEAIIPGFDRAVAGNNGSDNSKEAAAH